MKATLVVVPSHLTTQWTSEVHKFLGNTYTILTIEGVDDLKKLTISDIERSDIIVSAER